MSVTINKVLFLTIACALFILVPINFVSAQELGSKPTTPSNGLQELPLDPNLSTAINQIIDDLSEHTITVQPNKNNFLKPDVGINDVPISDDLDTALGNIIKDMSDTDIQPTIEIPVPITHKDVGINDVPISDDLDTALGNIIKDMSDTDIQPTIEIPVPITHKDVGINDVPISHDIDEALGNLLKELIEQKKEVQPQIILFPEDFDISFNGPSEYDPGDDFDLGFNGPSEYDPGDDFDLGFNGPTKKINETPKKVPTDSIVPSLIKRSAVTNKQKTLPQTGETPNNNMFLSVIFIIISCVFINLKVRGNAKY